MQRPEIVAGIKNAIERGYSIPLAIQSFISAGYNVKDVEDSARVLGGSVLKPEELSGVPVQSPPLSIQSQPQQLPQPDDFSQISQLNFSDSSVSQPQKVPQSSPMQSSAQSSKQYVPQVPAAYSQAKQSRPARQQTPPVNPPMQQITQPLSFSQIQTLQPNQNQTRNPNQPQQQNQNPYSQPQQMPQPLPTQPQSLPQDFGISSAQLPPSQSPPQNKSPIPWSTYPPEGTSKPVSVSTEKKSSKGIVLVIILAIVLLLLVGVLISTIFFKDQIISWVNGILGSSA